MSEERLPCPICGGHAKAIELSSSVHALCNCMLVGPELSCAMPWQQWNERARHAHELRQRAERAEAEVEKLEKVLDSCSGIIDRVKRQCGDYREQVSDLQKEVERLREALRFYAETKNICIKNDRKGTVSFESGAIARKALGGGE